MFSLSILQAEDMGLFLAASMVKALGWNLISFHYDCMILLDAAEAKNLFERQTLGGQTFTCKFI